MANYLTKLSALSEGKRYVTDKMPQNFMFVPLILTIMPAAKIIHVTREPKAIYGQTSNTTLRQTDMDIVTIF